MAGVIVQSILFPIVSVCFVCGDSFIFSQLFRDFSRLAQGKAFDLLGDSIYLMIYLLVLWNQYCS